jgi:serine/threonine protein kinase
MHSDEETQSRLNEPPCGKDAGRLDGLTEYLGLDPAGTDHDPLIGHDIGGVTILRPIAEGGMGRVYEGLQKKPKRSVAVKLIRPGFVSKDICRRFDNESELLGKLRHPFIAQIYSAGTCRIVGTEMPFFVMEYIPNALSLTRFAVAYHLTIHQRLELFRRVCEAVAYGHANGVIHRDLKPNNILVEPTGIPKVIDFGVARSIDLGSEQLTALTDVGQLIGTVQYMSPEQFSGDPAQIDTRSDVYALGVILYELLTGSPPYRIRAKQIFEAAEVVRNHKLQPASELARGVRPVLDQIASTCLEKERDRRFADAAALASALGAYLQSDSPPATQSTRRTAKQAQQQPIAHRTRSDSRPNESPSRGFRDAKPISRAKAYLRAIIPQTSTQVAAGMAFGLLTVGVGLLTTILKAFERIYRDFASTLPLPLEVAVSYSGLIAIGFLLLTALMCGYTAWSAPSREKAAVIWTGLLLWSGGYLLFVVILMLGMLVQLMKDLS